MVALVGIFRTQTHRQTDRQTDHYENITSFLRPTKQTIKKGARPGPASCDP